MVTALVVAAGSSRRMGTAGDKLLAPVAGHPVIAHTLAALSACEEIHDLVLVGGEDRLPFLQQLLAAYKFTKVRVLVPGGATRQQSVAKGLAAIDWPADLVAVHDGARPCVDREDICRVVADARLHGAAVLATPLVDTVKRVEQGLIRGEVDRSSLWAVQTPQVFRLDWLRAAYAAPTALKAVTDDAALVSLLGYEIKITPGSVNNFKVTTPEDLWRAEIYLKRRGLLCE